MRLLLAFFLVFLLASRAATAECTPAPRGIKACVEYIGAARHIITSNARGDVLRYEMVVPAQMRGEDFLINLVPFALLFSDQSRAERGAFMEKVLATLKTGREVAGNGYWWWARRSGNEISIVADRRD